MTELREKMEEVLYKAHGNIGWSFARQLVDIQLAFEVPGWVFQSKCPRCHGRHACYTCGISGPRPATLQEVLDGSAVKV